MTTPKVLAKEGSLVSRSSMGPSCRSALIGLAATSALLAAAQPSQALLVYSAAGSSISGSLGGTAFVDASWSMTATADETQATLSSFTAPGVGTFDLWWLPVNPRVKIQTLASLLEADLLPSTPFRWLALSGTFPVGPTPKIGFVYTTPFFNPETAAGVFGVPGSFVNLQTPTSFAGASIFETNSYPSSAGPLVISSSAEVPGVFRIDPVPGPLPALALAGAFSWSRRLRARRARRGA
jgi:hypothetical protein